MKCSRTYLLLIVWCALTSTGPTLASAQTRADQQTIDTHVLHGDVSYGEHGRQVMDIHLARDATRRGGRNYTIVFLHGGGFSFGDKSENGRYVMPFLRDGMNVVNMSYRIRQGVAAATEDLTLALNHLARNRDRYTLDLSNVIVAGFSAGATIATTVGFSQDHTGYPFPLMEGIRIVGILNFSGPVDQLEMVEGIFNSSTDESWKMVGRNLFPPNPRFGREEMIERFTPFTYFDGNVPPFFLSHGGMDDQIPPSTFTRFTEALTSSSVFHRIVFYPEAGHSLGQKELQDTFIEVFRFLDGLPRAGR